jgi:hypothetical protein
MGDWDAISLALSTGVPDRPTAPLRVVSFTQAASAG